MFGPERYQRTGAMAPKRNEHFEIRIKFPNQADNRPNGVCVSSPRIKTEIHASALGD